MERPLWVSFIRLASGSGRKAELAYRPRETGPSGWAHFWQIRRSVQSRCGAASPDRVSSKVSSSSDRCVQKDTGAAGLSGITRYTLIT